MAKKSSDFEELVQQHIVRVETTRAEERAVTNAREKDEKLERERREASEKARCTGLVDTATRTVRSVMAGSPTLRRCFDTRSDRFWDVIFPWGNGGYSLHIWDVVRLVKTDEGLSMYIGINRRDGSILNGSPEILLLLYSEYWIYKELHEAPSHAKKEFEATLTNFLDPETAIKYLLKEWGW